MLAMARSGDYVLFSTGPEPEYTQIKRRRGQQEKRGEQGRRPPQNTLTSLKHGLFASSCLGFLASFLHFSLGTQLASVHELH
jgi:hypothetical protein